MRDIALVTGASSGIGKEFVRQIAKKYKGLDEIWVIARRKDKLRELKKEIIGTRVRILLNCEALTRVTYLVLPYVSRGSFIYQMASSAGFAPQPDFTVYAATKAYAKSFSIALRQELSGQEVKVIAVCPGPVKTEFFDRAYEQEEMKFYKKFAMADPKRVVSKAIRDARKNKAVSVYGFTMKTTRIICKILPGKWIAKIMG